MFVYPDIYTVIVGKFEGDKLISGFTSTIQDIMFENHILIPRASKRFFGVEIVRDVASNKCISQSPMQRDYFEVSRLSAALEIQFLESQ